ncbi:ubiquitin-like protein 5 [Dictyostelium discoideum AX4]|uniref:ubiquitin-like protein 5 n=1 Tax=Dictyostelium discoideum AX4 TaxID=352472 RepID=UPI00004E4DF4|nr:ubiquitin-like protein 5 [Dictyostelium discoideum AX4]EAL65291.1 ubiquitin-like protein 5 [Dictyostelium discoideum AX4]|eukprot:XP_638642.1 ubiquitin-like protein 5 [Dictyostelium discoideum AX4]
MIEVVCNDRLGNKVRVKVNSDDTIGDLKKVLSAQIGIKAEKIRLQKSYSIFKDRNNNNNYNNYNNNNNNYYYYYEIHDGDGLELYYN